MVRRRIIMCLGRHREHHAYRPVSICTVKPWGVARTAVPFRRNGMSDSERVQPLLLVQYYVFTKSAQSMAGLISECLNEISAAIRRGETAGQVTELPGAIPPLCEWHISN